MATAQKIHTSSYEPWAPKYAVDANKLEHRNGFLLILEMGHDDALSSIGVLYDVAFKEHRRALHLQERCTGCDLCCQASGAPTVS